MLKIRDDVELKKLEDFGFYLNKKEWYEKFYNNYIFLNVKPLSREVVYSVYEKEKIECDDLDDLYDLIKANLVVKE